MKRDTVLVVAALVLAVAGNSLAGPAGVDLDAIIFSDDFDGYEPAPFDSHTAYVRSTEGAPVDTYDPAVVALMPDFTTVDPGWSNMGADYIIIADGQYIDPCGPAMGDHALCVYRAASSQGLWEVGYAFRDITSVIDNSSKVGDRLLVSFDVFMPYASDSWDPRGFQLLILTRSEKHIVRLFACGYLSAGSQWLMVEGDDDKEVPGAKWDAPAWNHYELYIHFGEHHVKLYIGDETAPRHTLPLPEEYTLEDIQGIGFGSLIYYKRSWIHDAHFDNIVVSTNFMCPAGDIEGDCAVNMMDLSILLHQWLQAGTPVS